MKFKKLFIVPIVLLLITVVTSILAFQNSNQLEKGYLYFSERVVSPTYDGEYFAIFGNLKETDYTITIESLDDYIHITTKDSSEKIMKDIAVTIKETDTLYDSSIVTNNLTTTTIVIDELDDYIFTVSLDAGKTYELSMTKTDQNTDDASMDMVLAQLPEYLLNMKSLNESIAFSSFVFSILSLGTIVAILFIKKD